MLIPSPKWLRGGDVPASEVTPRAVFEQRRRWLAMAAAGAAGSTLAPWFSREAFAQGGHGQKLAATPNNTYVVTEKRTPYEDVTTYNNYYEFGTDKSDPAQNAGTLRPRPWQVAVEGRATTAKTIAEAITTRSAASAACARPTGSRSAPGCRR